MKFDEDYQSENIEDRRGQRASGAKLAGGGGLVLTIVIVVAYVAMGGDAREGLEVAQQVNKVRQRATEPQDGADGAGRPDPTQDRAAKFVSAVLRDTEVTWGPLFKQMGETYREPKLVLFTEAVDSACGYQTAAVGPFYCPADEKAYLDLTFFGELDTRFGAPGDFAQAYVVAHEVGHHVQNLLGTSTRVHRQKQGLPEAEANALTVRLELQADCYSGVWAHHAEEVRDVLESGDVEEGLAAAHAIGDDTLQKRAQGRVVPETFTHGTSAQRVKWFKRPQSRTCASKLLARPRESTMNSLYPTEFHSSGRDRTASE